MGLLLAIEIIKSAFFSLQVFIPSTWCQENMAVYYKALVKKCALIAIFPDKHHQFKWTKLKSSFEIRLYIFVFFVFFCCILMSLISLTVTTYALCPLSTTKWLMCENGMNPRVPLSSKSNLQPCPQNNTLVPFRALFQNFWWTHPLLFGSTPPLSQEWRVSPIWLNSLYGENYFNWLIHHSVIPSYQIITCQISDYSKMI